MSAPLEAALDYASRGWPVFPCHPETKQPLTPKAEGGNGGLKAASTDTRVINTWWRKHPTAMIGVPTGPSIGAFVVDLDAGIDAKTGEVFEVDGLIAALEHKIGCRLPPTCSVATPRGGRHLYFRVPDGECPGNRAGLVPRVDIRGTGGYVIVPPSRRTDGKSYVWVTPHGDGRGAGSRAAA
jgi:putative DNA primase/helicase